MNQKNKSLSKQSPVKLTKKRSASKEEPLLKGKWDQIPSANKSSKSSNSMNPKTTVTKSSKKPVK